MISDILNLAKSMCSINLITRTSIILLVTSVIVYLVKIWRSYSFFKQRGLLNPEPEFFYGNFRQLMRNKNYSEKLKEWSDKYGKTYGYFEGHQPVIVTSDLGLIQHLFIKESSCFSARKKGYLNRRENDPTSNLFFCSKIRWKKMRTIMNPTFSSAKLKQLGPILEKCVDRLIDLLKKEDESEVNVADYFKRFTMDSIWNCAFGVDLNSQYDKENEYYNKCEEVVKTTTELTKPEYLGAYFHEFKEIFMDWLMIFIRILSIFIDTRKMIPIFWIYSKIGDLVEIRKNENESNRKYFIQLLTNTDSNDENKGLTRQEIESNLILFMFAGYETTSTALCYSVYALAINKEEQIRLLDEINFQYGSNVVIDYENVQKLEYLDWFLKEVLRFFPIANSAITRRCTKKTNINGIDIPIDTPIAVDVLSLHFDSDIWGPVDPYTFYPSRHQIKRNPLAFMAFGNGPRNCIGMKFALIELKMALVKLILNFEISTTNKITGFEEVSVRYPKNNFMIKLTIRKS